LTLVPSDAKQTFSMTASDSQRVYRVVQWATGSIGQIAIRHFVDNPVFDLAGVYVTNPDKVGKDAGELAGTRATGVRATDDADATIALDADCIYYAPLRSDLDTVCRVLRSGTNVVTPAGYFYPTPSTAADFDALQRACVEGGTTLHGTGIHPGFSGDLLPLTFARLMTRVEQVQLRETADFRLHPSEPMMQSLGFGADPVSIAERQSPILEMMKTAYEPSLRMLAEGLGVAVDRVTLDFEAARAKRDLELRWGVVRKGTVGGMRFEWNAWADDRSVVVYRTFWKVDDDLDPDWGYGTIKYHMLIEGDPPVELSFQSARKHPDGDEGYWGRVWTAMMGINAIPAVCDAEPGVLTHFDLGLVQPRGLVRPRSADFGEPVGSW
jgi:hypothetical protein